MPPAGVAAAVPLFPPLQFGDEGTVFTEVIPLGEVTVAVTLTEQPLASVTVTV